MNFYSIKDAIMLSKSFLNTNEDKNINVSFKLNLTSGKKKHSFNHILELPVPIIKTVPKIAVFVDDSQKQKIIKDNVIVLGSDTLVKYLTDNKGDLNITHCVGTPDMLRHINSVKNILNDHSLLPTLRNGLIKPNVNELIKQINNYGVKVKNDKNGYIHISIGKTNLIQEDLDKNLDYLLDFLILNKPKGLKSNFILKSYVNIDQLKSFAFIIRD